MDKTTGSRMSSLEIGHRNSSGMELVDSSSPTESEREREGCREVGLKLKFLRDNRVRMARSVASMV